MNIIVVLVVLASLIATRLVNYTKNDYTNTNTKIDWKVDLSYLRPMNQSFEDYNVVLDGHIHTTVSDSSLPPALVVDLAYGSYYSRID